LRLILTGGQVADITQGPALVESFATEAVVADKGDDSNAFVGTIHTLGAQAVIPPRSNRLTPRSYDKERYKARNLVERFFNRLKQFRRLATRYSLRQARISLQCVLANGMCLYLATVNTL
jgi:transposase